MAKGLKIMITAALVVLMSLMAGAGAAVATTCQSAHGTVVEYLDATGSYGTVSGDLEGDYKFTLTSLSPVGESTWLRFTGTAVITTAAGTITSTDSGMLNTETDVVRWNSSISGGSGDYADASGQLFYQGTLDFDTGEGTARYQGALCTP